MRGGQRFGASWAIFRNRNFSLWVVGSSLSLIGFWAQRVGVAWLAWQMTGSSLFVAVVAAADLLPAVALTPYAGMIGDRHDRLAIIWWTQIGATAASILLYCFFLLDSLSAELLVAIVALNGAAMGLKQPARMAMLRNLVSLPQLPAAIAVGSIIFNLARFIGPAVAGVCLGFGRLDGVFLIAILLSFSLLVALRAMRLPAGAARPSVPVAGEAWEGIAGGLRFVAAHPGVRAILVLQLGSALALRGYAEVLPGFSDDVLGAGADGLAMLTAGIGAGAVIAGAWLVLRTGSQGLIRIAIGAQIVGLLSVSGLSLSQSFFWALLLSTVYGFAITGAGIAAQTLVQRSMPEHVLARVLAIYSLINWAGPAFGALLLGWLADMLGFRIPLLGGALAMCVVVLLTLGPLWRAQDDLERK